MAPAIEAVGMTNITGTHDTTVLALESIVTWTSFNMLMWAVQLGTSMFIMGSECSHANFSWQFRHPSGLWVGIVIVQLIMPLAGFIIARVLRLDNGDAIGLIVLTSCPSDGLSSVFSYWTDSDVCLSLSITFLSIAMCVGFIPFGISIYSQAWSELHLTIIPHTEVLFLLVIVLVALGLGLAIRHISEKWADLFAKFASPVPLLVILFSIIVTMMYAPRAFNGSWKEWLAGAVVPLCGFILGYGFGLLSQQPAVACRSIAFSSANKSLLLSAYVIVNSFSSEVVIKSVPLLGISAVTYILEGMFFVMLYRSVIWYLE